MLNPNPAFSRVVEILGGRAATASLFQVSATAIDQWEKGERPLPIDRCIEAEEAVQGRVRCEELRPDKARHFAYLRRSMCAQTGIAPTA